MGNGNASVHQVRLPSRNVQIPLWAMATLSGLSAALKTIFVQIPLWAMATWVDWETGEILSKVQIPLWAMATVQIVNTGVAVTSSDSSMGNGNGADCQYRCGGN